MANSQKISREQWESICDRCGKCCLIKLEDEDSGEIYYTNIICRYYDLDKNLCTIYSTRQQLVPECIELNEENVSKISWMPKTCAYRQLFDKNYQPAKPCNLKGKVISEDLVEPSDYENHLIDPENL